MTKASRSTEPIPITQAMVLNEKRNARTGNVPATEQAIAAFHGDSPRKRRASTHQTMAERPTPIAVETSGMTVVGSSPVRVAIVQRPSAMLPSMRSALVNSAVASSSMVRLKEKIS